MHFLAPAQWIFVAEVQKWKRLAKAMGCFHQLLLILLQVTSGSFFSHCRKHLVSSPDLCNILVKFFRENERKLSGSSENIHPAREVRYKEIKKFV